MRREKSKSAIFRRDQLPKCSSLNCCTCFEVLSIFDWYFDNMSNYTRKVRQQLEYFQHIIEIHRNKDKQLNTSESTKISGMVVRTVLYYANMTRSYFVNQLQLHGDCVIRLESNVLNLSDLLTCYRTIYEAWDTTLAICYKPESEIPMSTLSSFLTSHHELITFFEKYDQHILSSKIVTMSTFIGNQDVHHLSFQ